MHTDKPLFTPGPLTTSLTVKQAMLHDLGSRDFEFIRIVREIRQELLKLAEADGRGYEAILMQGSGTFGIESVIGSITPPDGKWLFVVNGAYGQRMMQIAKALKIDASAVTFPESRPAVAEAVAAALDHDPRHHPHRRRALRDHHGTPESHPGVGQGSRRPREGLHGGRHEQLRRHADPGRRLGHPLSGVLGQ